MRPNLIFFMPDQFRADHLGHLSPAKASHTPNLDQLILNDGISIENNFCQNPVCTPSRCSIMSGCYPHVAGHRTMHHFLHPQDPNLLDMLHQAGYHIWWGGKNDLLPDLPSHVDTYNEPVEEEICPSTYEKMDWRPTDPSDPLYYSFLAGTLEPTDENGHHMDLDRFQVLSACRFLSEYKEERPIALFLTFRGPHPPYAAEKLWIDIITDEHLKDRIPAPDWKGKPQILKAIHQRQHLNLTDNDWKSIQKIYAASCMRMDHMAGMVLDTLRESGLYDNSAFFFFSDHGDFTGDYELVEKTQNTFEDVLTHTPMIFKAPASYPVQPGIRKVLSENLDLFATVIELADLKPTHSHFGHSLLPCLQPLPAFRSYVCCEGGRLKGETHCSEAESPGSFDPTDLYWPRVGLQVKEDPMYHTKATMIRTASHKYVRRLYESDELYDLLLDPEELHNVIQDPAYASVLSELKDQLLTFYQETSDIVPLIPDER